MKASRSRFYRIYVVTYENWSPEHWRQRPPSSQRLELADEALFSRRQATDFLKGFNSQMMLTPGRHWAVADPVG
jgi:hypothetical protein